MGVAAFQNNDQEQNGSTRPGAALTPRPGPRNAALHHMVIFL